MSLARGDARRPSSKPRQRTFGHGPSGHTLRTLPRFAAGAGRRECAPLGDARWLPFRRARERHLTARIQVFIILGQMGLDATVFCDCFERGRLREGPPADCRVVLAADGDLYPANEETLDIDADVDLYVRFDQWRGRACSHEDGVLISHRIGNMALVAALRSVLEHAPARFPIILQRVIYSGTHAGDSIPATDIPSLSLEVSGLSSLHSPDSQMENIIRRFEAQMAELVKAAIEVGKPISF